MNDNELLRYSRQLMLPGFDVAGQLALKSAHVLVIGAGGLGSPASLYLAAAGVGSISIVDHDEVELSNLQRQIAHTEKSVGQNKADSARNSMLALNSSCQVLAVCERFEEKAWQGRFEQYSLVLDCTDNFEARFAINRLCVTSKVPLVSAAAIRMEGQFSVFDPRKPESPCYRCLYTEGGDEQLNCSTNGVMAPLVGVMGSLQALEAIKLIADFGESSVGKLLIYDALDLTWRSLKLPKDKACPVCG